jgi:hypothetical protein
MTRKISQLDLLGLPVSVINYCDLEFIWNLVLEIWDLYHFLIVNSAVFEAPWPKFVPKET